MELLSGERVSTHSRLKAADLHRQRAAQSPTVSTHSRLKAAAGLYTPRLARQGGFNTQPPEGGCTYTPIKATPTAVSTHSRLKAADPKSKIRGNLILSFNTQPPEGGWIIRSETETRLCVSTHSRLKAADGKAWKYQEQTVFQHTAA